MAVKWLQKIMNPNKDKNLLSPKIKQKAPRFPWYSTFTCNFANPNGTTNSHNQLDTKIVNKVNVIQRTIKLP